MAKNTAIILMIGGFFMFIMLVLLIIALWKAFLEEDDDDDDDIKFKSFLSGTSEADVKFQQISVKTSPIFAGGRCDELPTATYRYPQYDPISGGVRCINISDHTKYDCPSGFKTSASSYCVADTTETPVNCVITYGPWGECVDGTQTREETSRTTALYGGTACGTPVLSQSPCGADDDDNPDDDPPVNGDDDDLAAIDCVITYGPWGMCEPATSTKTRTEISRKEAENGGTVCPSILQEKTEACTPCKHTEWGAWTACSAQCGSGTRTRTRSVIEGECTGAIEQTEHCNTTSCPAPPTTNRLILKQGAKCLDFSPSAGNEPKLVVCNGANEQKWHWLPTTQLKSNPEDDNYNLCLTRKNDGTLYMADCLESDNLTKQQWNFLEGTKGLIRNPSTKKCLNNDGANVYTSECDTTSATADTMFWIWEIAGAAVTAIFNAPAAGLEDIEDVPAATLSEINGNYEFEEKQSGRYNYYNIGIQLDAGMVVHLTSAQGAMTVDVNFNDPNPNYTRGNATKWNNREISIGEFGSWTIGNGSDRVTNIDIDLVTGDITLSGYFWPEEDGDDGTFNSFTISKSAKS